MEIKLTREAAAEVYEALGRVFEMGRIMGVRSVTLSAPHPDMVADDGSPFASVSADFHPIEVDVTNEQD